MRVPTAASFANAQNICSTAQDDQHLSFSQHYKYNIHCFYIRILNLLLASVTTHAGLCFMPGGTTRG